MRLAEVNLFGVRGEAWRVRLRSRSSFVRSSHQHLAGFDHATQGFVAVVRAPLVGAADVTFVGIAIARPVRVSVMPHLCFLRRDAWNGGRLADAVLERGLRREQLLYTQINFGGLFSGPKPRPLFGTENGAVFRHRKRCRYCSAF